MAGAMPVFQSTSSRPPEILSKDGPRIVAYRLTPEAVKRLREAGVRHGREVPGRLLAALIRTGGAHSPAPADAAGQARLFVDDDTPDHLPRCEMTGSTADLHLVVYGEGGGRLVRLLAPEPRFVLQKATTVSIPVAVLGLARLDLLEHTDKMPSGSAAAATLRAWFRQDLDSAWEKLAAQLAAAQPELELGRAEGELPL
jgi:hypothetical protein